MGELSKTKGVRGHGVGIFARAAGDPEASTSIQRRTYFLGRETVLPSDRPGMSLWYKIRPTQVIEIGSEIEI